MTSIATTHPVSVFANGDDWTTYEAELTFTGKLYGGSPFDPTLVEGWLKSNLGITDEDQLKRWTIKHLAEVQGLDPLQPTEEAIDKAIEDGAMEKKAQGFKRTVDGNKPYIEGRHLKAMIKENTNIVFPQGANKFGQYASSSKERKGQLVGGKSPKAFVAERVWVPEQPFVVADDSDGFEFAVGHLEDFRGTRSTIGYYEYVTQSVLRFTVQVLDDCLSGDQWAKIMRSAERNGLGARRSQGGGQFVVTAWDRL